MTRSFSISPSYCVSKRRGRVRENGGDLVCTGRFRLARVPLAFALPTRPCARVSLLSVEDTHTYASSRSEARRKRRERGREDEGKIGRVHARIDR